jgi:hypothetical protein
MKMKKTNTRTIADLRREADKLIANGKMPSFEEVVRAVGEAKKYYRAFERIKRAGVVQ